MITWYCLFLDIWNCCCVRGHIEILFCWRWIQLHPYRRWKWICHYRWLQGQNCILLCFWMRLVCFWLFLCLGIVFGGWLIHLEGIWRGLAYFWIGFMLILNMVGILVEFKERRWLLDRFYSRQILTKNLKNMEKLNTKWSRKYFNCSW